VRERADDDDDDDLLQLNKSSCVGSKKSHGNFMVGLFGTDPEPRVAVLQSDSFSSCIFCSI
jgi:hypothetical protein